MANEEKNTREFEFEVEQKGKPVKRAFKLTEVSLNQQNEATKVYKSPEILCSDWLIWFVGSK